MEHSVTVPSRTAPALAKLYPITLDGFAGTSGPLKDAAARAPAMLGTEHIGLQRATNWHPVKASEDRKARLRRGPEGGSRCFGSSFLTHKVVGLGSCRHGIPEGASRELADQANPSET